MVTPMTWNRAICYPHVRSYIDIQSGDIFQSVHVDLQGGVFAVRVDGDEIFIAGYHASKVVVLQFAGSEV